MLNRAHLGQVSTREDENLVAVQYIGTRRPQSSQFGTEELEDSCGSLVHTGMKKLGSNVSEGRMRSPARTELRRQSTALFSSGSFSIYTTTRRRHPRWEEGLLLSLSANALMDPLGDVPASSNQLTIKIKHYGEQSQRLTNINGEETSTPLDKVVAWLQKATGSENTAVPPKYIYPPHQHPCSPLSPHPSIIPTAPACR